MGSALSSTMEFHSPQAEHLPAHWVVILPHCWQLYVAFLAIFFSHGLFRSYRCGPYEVRRILVDQFLRTR